MPPWTERRPSICQEAILRCTSFIDSTSPCCPVMVDQVQEDRLGFCAYGWHRSHSLLGPICLFPNPIITLIHGDSGILFKFPFSKEASEIQNSPKGCSGHIIGTTASSYKDLGRIGCNPGILVEITSYIQREIRAPLWDNLWLSFRSIWLLSEVLNSNYNQFFGKSNAVFEI